MKGTLRLRLGEARRHLALAAAALWRRRPAPSPPQREPELLGRVDELNAAAERQWQSMNGDPERRGDLLTKPYTSAREAPALLYRLGLALEALDLGLGQTVLDFGAGSCWVSLALNRLRCRTISVDVSATALAIGREAFGRDPYARPELAPRFLQYDGRRIPLPDAAVDRALCFDSFHHVPNQDEILAELYRVLREGGRVVMAEPGLGHAHADASVFDAESYGVLENELVFDDLIDRIRRAGFGDVQVKPYPDVPILVLSATAHQAFLAGDHSLFPMNHMVDSLRQFHLLILHKGRPARDSRNPGLLRAKISVVTDTPLRGRAGTLVDLVLRVRNDGDTLWLSTEERTTGGYVSVGGHLLDAEGRAARIGFFTERLPRDVAPGEEVEVACRFGLPSEAGRHRLRLDLVADRVAWFSQTGSPTRDVELHVAWSDSREPHRLGARIELVGAARVSAAAVALRLSLANVGDTIWLHEPQGARGTVAIGVQRLGAATEVLERDYLRLPLPASVAPGERVLLEAVVPRLDGASRFALDLVAEQVSWFATHGSAPLVVEVA